MGITAAYHFLAECCVGVDVAGVVFYAELFPHHIRAKDIALSIAVIALTELVYLQAMATAFANIGWEFYLLFIIVSGLSTVFVCWFLPETKNIQLEEMAKLFGDGDGIAVYADDIRCWYIGVHGATDGMHRVATEFGVPEKRVAHDKEVSHEVQSAGSSV